MRYLNSHISTEQAPNREKYSPKKFSEKIFQTIFEKKQFKLLPRLLHAFPRPLPNLSVKKNIFTDFGITGNGKTIFTGTVFSPYLCITRIICMRLHCQLRIGIFI